MSKKSYISEAEVMVVRIGLANGVKPTIIAKYMGRHKNTVYAIRDREKQAGTLGNLPFDFLVQDVLAGMERVRNG